MHMPKITPAVIRCWVACLCIGLMVSSHAQGPQTVDLSVNYNDGVEKRFVLPYTPGMTVFDAMTLAQKNPHGLKFYCENPSYPCNTAPATNGLITRIDDVKNEGAGAGAKNWQLWVNGIYADKGFGACGIDAKAKVLWKFDKFHGGGGRVCK